MEPEEEDPIWMAASFVRIWELVLREKTPGLKCQIAVWKIEISRQILG